MTTALFHVMVSMMVFGKSETRASSFLIKTSNVFVNNSCLSSLFFYRDCASCCVGNITETHGHANPWNDVLSFSGVVIVQQGRRKTEIITNISIDENRKIDDLIIHFYVPSGNYPAQLENEAIAQRYITPPIKAAFRFLPSI